MTEVTKGRLIKRGKPPHHCYPYGWSPNPLVGDRWMCECGRRWECVDATSSSATWRIYRRPYGSRAWRKAALRAIGGK